MAGGATFDIPGPKQGLGDRFSGLLEGLGGLLKRGGETALGAGLGPIALGDAFQGGTMPGFGQMSPLQQGALIRSALPNISFTRGNRTVNLGGGGGLTQAMLMSRLMGQMGGGGDFLRSGGGTGGGTGAGINPRAQTRTVRQLVEPTSALPYPQGPNVLNFGP